MRGNRVEIEDALIRLAAVVSDRLAGEGWARRNLGERNVATVTRSAEAGVIVVLDLDRTSYSYPDYWPVEVAASLGIGFEPAVDLMPLLTLEPRAALVAGPTVRRLVIDLDGEAAIEQAATRIVDFVDNQAGPLARLFPDAASIYTQFDADVARVEQSADAEEDGDPEADDFDTQVRLLLLASTGRADEAHEQLDRYRTRITSPADEDQRRFIRQLTRRLEAGLPVPPPIEQTLAQLPRESRPLRTARADFRAQFDARTKARNTVRAQAKGKSIDELRVLLETEYAQRGLEVAPSAIQVSAEMMHTAQQPFGRARNAITAFRALKAGGGQLVHLIRDDIAADPAWLLPPERASYPLVAQSRRWAAVDIDPAAVGWLERVYAAAPHRMGLSASIGAWLTRDPSGLVVVHIGEQRVGTIAQSNAEQFAAALRAAALFDEDPIAQARLSRAATEIMILEIPVPEPAATDR